jgi:hypothetical protein
MGITQASGAVAATTAEVETGTALAATAQGALSQVLASAREMSAGAEQVLRSPSTFPWPAQRRSGSS